MWEEELMRQSQMAASIAALSPAQRAAYNKARAAEAAEQEAYTVALMARLAAEAKKEDKDKPAVHPMLLMREQEEGRVLLQRSWEMEDAVWDQPFSRYLEESYHGLFDCGSMPERDYAAFMQWLFSNGFEVCAQSHRGRVRASWADLPARHWKPTQAPKWRPQEGVIQRFCIKCPAGAPAEGCKYVHGDIIQRVNFPCKFALTCSGTKRANCLHMHPDETWTPDMVIRRTPVALPPQVLPPQVPVTLPPQVPQPKVPSMASILAGGGAAPAPEPETYEGAWDAEDAVAPEVKVITVTAEEMELEERNKHNRLVQAGADAIIAKDRAATTRSHAIPGYTAANRKERIRILFNALGWMERASLPAGTTAADFDLLGDRLIFIGASESEERDGLYGLGE